MAPTFSFEWNKEVLDYHLGKKTLSKNDEEHLELMRVTHVFVRMEQRIA